jgi:RNA polymerase sigma factor (TIGR02999 family)
MSNLWIKLYSLLADGVVTQERLPGCSRSCTPNSAVWHPLHTREQSGQSIQPTELVHDAYLRLVGQERINWQGRSHFMGMAAISMRRILVERARRKSAEKRGGGGEKVPLDDLDAFTPEKSLQLLALDEALDRLADLSSRQSRIVELRFFAGLNFDEIAKLEALSLRTVKHDWSAARAWLHREIARAI